MFFATVINSEADSQISDYQQQLRLKAMHLNLAHQRSWQLLLHIVGDDGAKSKIDDPAFFLSPSGMFNSQQELYATIDGFFAPASLADKHPRCRYPAREAWLTEQLDIDKTRLAQPLCTERDSYLETLNPRSASIMFPAAYMNSPASMFGHTYIRIDSNYKSELLSYAVNYAAETDEENGMVYAWKGIFGLYKGFYSILPQYAKIREYSNLEHRDIWDYRLNLNKSEILQMARHIWELQRIYSDYYFFDENCSYNLLFLLEVARPTIHLTDKTSLFVVPLDTIKLIRKNGLIDSTAYRPSQGLKISAMTDKMSSADILQAQKLALGEISPDIITDTASRTSDIRILDLATELLQFSYNKQKISQEIYRPRLLYLLKQRSQFSHNSEMPVYSIPTPEPPEVGHESRRVSIGAGNYDKNGYLMFGIRPAYHSLEDPAAGYLMGAEIQFFNTAIRYFTRTNHTQLQKLQFVEILSLSDFEPIFKRTSWNVSAALEQIKNKNGAEVLALKLNTGGGLTTTTKLGTMYVLLQTEGLLGERVEKQFGLGAGLNAGIIKQVYSKIQLQLLGSSIYYGVGEKQLSSSLKSSLNIFSSKNTSFETSYTIFNNKHHKSNDAQFFWHYYF